MAELIKLETLIAGIRSEGGGEANVQLLKQQAGFARAVVHLDRNVDSEFVEWRPNCDLGKHTKLKWLPQFYFFEHESDAMMFLLAFSDAPDQPPV